MVFKTTFKMKYLFILLKQEFIRIHLRFFVKCYFWITGCRTSIINAVLIHFSVILGSYVM